MENFYISRKSLKVDYQVAEKSSVIDPATAEHVELLHSLGRADHGLLGRDVPSVVLSLLSESSHLIGWQLTQSRVRVRRYLVVHGYNRVGDKVLSLIEFNFEYGKIFKWVILAYCIIIAPHYRDSILHRSEKIQVFLVRNSEQMWDLCRSEASQIQPLSTSCWPWTNQWQDS